MTGDKDLKLADHYSSCNEDDQKEFSLEIMKYIREEHSKENSAEVNENESFENVVSFAKLKNVGVH